tara:strand:+ start:160 stop:2844 length:2685 start_codon:yes stop_codon:yes gene_type:complete
MSGWKKLAAASAGGDDPLNVENVFSTFLYQGISSGLAINNGIALGDGPDGTTGTSTRFDGTNDSLNKSSDLSGNSNGKTFTFSFWVNPTQDTNTDKRIYHTSGSWRNEIRYGNDGGLFVVFFNNESSGGTVFEIQSPDIKLAMGGWNHVLISADLTDTSKRHLYINDNLATPGWSYTNNTIDWTRSTHAIGDDLTATTGNFQGDLAHFFLDYTYRDFSVESNRRIFIDSAFGSTSVSTLSALNPIIYLPMTTGYSVGENEGTGGNFSAVGSPSIVSNGTQAEAGIGQGGMVWVKNRSGTDNHILTSNPPNYISPNQNVTQYTGNYNFITKFTSNGFFLGGGVWGSNSVSNTSVAWTWRKALKFFDIINYSGTGSNRTVNHNLGSVPGMILIKDLDRAEHWAVYHRSVGNTKYLKLSTTDSATTDSGFWQNTDPTSTQFSLGNNGAINENNSNYVAYLFAHNNNDGEFGPNGDADIIKCGSYSGNSSGENDDNGPEINLGFEPQWVMIKSDTWGSGNWQIFDTMRGIASRPQYNSRQGDDFVLYPNTTAAEAQSASYLRVTSTGFKLESDNYDVNASIHDYIYVAIRRGPMAETSSGADVFKATYGNASADQPPGWSSPASLAVDSSFDMNIGGGSTDDISVGGRLIQGRYTGNLANTSGPQFYDWTDYSYDYQNGFRPSCNGATDLGYMWSRRRGAYDTLTFIGTGSNTTNTHNLDGEVGMAWWFPSGTQTQVYVYARPLGANKYLRLNLSNSVSTDTTIWQNTHPTNTQFYTGGGYNNTNANHFLWLFGNLSGVSKVGTFTGNGSNQNIDCGFSNGIRLLMIKKTNSTGNWYFWDEANLGTTNQPFWYIKTQAGLISNEDTIDTYSAGFNVKLNTNQSINTNGDTYLFYAVAA